MSKIQKPPKGFESKIFGDLDDMEVDVFEVIPDWVALRLKENIEIIEELA